MFQNKKYIKFLQKSKAINADIICVNILKEDNKGLKHSIKNMFINSNGDSIGFEFSEKLKNFILIHSKEFFKEKKGKLIKFNINKTKWNELFEMECWAEPFFAKNDYGYLGEALKNAIKRVNTTLVRSIKHSGAHAFIPVLDEENNSFTGNKNIFYEKINFPIKLLLLGTAKGSVELVKTADLLGWQICLSDIRGGNFKRVKHLDEIVLLNEEKSISKVLEKQFDVSIIMDNQNKSELYLKELVNSNVKKIVLTSANNEIKNLDDRIVIISNQSHQPLERVFLEICKNIQNKIHLKKEIGYEFI